MNQRLENSQRDGHASLVIHSAAAVEKTTGLIDLRRERWMRPCGCVPFGYDVEVRVERERRSAARAWDAHHQTGASVDAAERRLCTGERLERSACVRNAKDFESRRGDLPAHEIDYSVLVLEDAALRDERLEHGLPCRKARLDEGTDQWGGHAGISIDHCNVR